jgi:hypothetical protein
VMAINSYQARGSSVMDIDLYRLIFKWLAPRSVL